MLRSGCMYYRTSVTCCLRSACVCHRAGRPSDLATAHVGVPQISNKNGRRIVAEKWARNLAHTPGCSFKFREGPFFGHESWPKKGLKFRAAFLQKNTLSHELALGLGHPTDVRPPAGSSDPTAQNTLTTRMGRRKTAKFDSDKQIAGQSYRKC